MMAFGWGGFRDDRRGTTFEGIALSVAVIAVAFVASADMLDFLMKKHAAPGEPVAVAAAKPHSSDLDLTPTASLPKLVTRSVLDPCTGAVK